MPNLETQTPGAPGVCPSEGATLDPTQCVDTDGWVAFLKARGIIISRRQSLRMFAESRFPRFFVGKRQYVEVGKGWEWVQARTRSGRLL